MLTMPNFFDASDRIKAISQPAPITKLNYGFSPLSMDRFTDTIEDMIDSGRLFEYEDYDYIDGRRVVSNLEQCVNLYTPTQGAFGITGYKFARRERIKDGRNINFVVYNKAVGWFSEIHENHSYLTYVVDEYVKKFNIDVWKILVFKVNTDLGWHMDVDGYYGFRLFLQDKDDWVLKFREVKPEYKELYKQMTWDGRWNQVHEMVDEATYPQEIVYTSKDTGQAFLINSMDYVHYFENKSTHYGVLVKGTV